ncbi:MAG: NrfD/PsrC family molybdoenzyme membrane anchor subunit, partial [Armatimonadota bacterium]
MTNARIRVMACCESPKMWLWVGLWAIAFALGSIGVVQRFLFGHKLAAYGNYVTWGLYVGVYIYLIGLSAGAFMLSSLVYVFGIKKFERIGPIALVVALVTLLTALLTVWFDLGHMERFYFVFTRPNFHSMMAWMVWLYTGYSLLLASELWLALRVTE